METYGPWVHDRPGPTGEELDIAVATIRQQVRGYRGEVTGSGLDDKGRAIVVIMFASLHHAAAAEDILGKDLDDLGPEFRLPAALTEGRIDPPAQNFRGPVSVRFVIPRDYIAHAVQHRSER